VALGSPSRLFVFDHVRSQGGSFRTRRRIQKISPVDYQYYARERHKAIAIPVAVCGTEKHFLIVHDRRYNEWTFVTGGCRRREAYNPLRCALRELEEETRGVLNLKKGVYTSFTFTTDTQEPRDVEEGVAALNYYHVYVIELHMTAEERTRVISSFYEEKTKMDESLVPYRKNNDENDACAFETLEAISARTDIWPMIRRNVLTNPEFQEALETTRKIPFNIKL
jgi:8-oxo-dGTP pyrophosphatase MutT (NUDIX family)